MSYLCTIHNFRRRGALLFQAILIGTLVRSHTIQVSSAICKHAQQLPRLPLLLWGHNLSSNMYTFFFFFFSSFSFPSLFHFLFLMIFFNFFRDSFSPFVSTSSKIRDGIEPDDKYLISKGYPCDHHHYTINAPEQ